MRLQRHVLKDHADGFGSQFSKSRFRQLINPLTGDYNVTRAGLD